MRTQTYTDTWSFLKPRLQALEIIGEVTLSKSGDLNVECNLSTISDKKLNVYCSLPGYEKITIGNGLQGIRVVPGKTFLRLSYSAFSGATLQESLYNLETATRLTFSNKIYESVQKEVVKLLIRNELARLVRLNDFLKEATGALFNA